MLTSSTESPTYRFSLNQFKAVQEYAYRMAGIELHDGKLEMVAGRLWKRARALGFESADSYFAAVQRDSSGELQTDILDALTTNYTSFFREPAHFDFLKNTILPQLQRRSHFTIWSAASSTGEEPYSIAVTVVESLGDAALHRAKIRASDLSTQVLRRAEAGVYPGEKFRNLSTDWKSRFLLKGKGTQQGNYRFRPEIRSMVEFVHINLMDPLPETGPFPLIFLRNIMIYFGRPTQERVIAAMTAKLEPGGYLFVGHSESLNGVRHELEHVQVAIYKKEGNLEDKAS